MNKKYKAILFCGIIAIATTLLFFGNNQDKKEGFFLRDEIDNYRLYNHKGELFKVDSFLSYPAVFFFGFLNCPDICPNTLTEISNIIVQLGNKRKKINFFFVTVDPERDTVKEMSKYLSNFNENIIGVTGNDENIKKFLKNMHVYYEKVFIDEDFYTLDHSSQMYLFEKGGKFFGTISVNENKNTVFEKIKSII